MRRIRTRRPVGVDIRFHQPCTLTRLPSRARGKFSRILVRIEMVLHAPPATGPAPAAALVSVLSCAGADTTPDVNGRYWDLFTNTRVIVSIVNEHTHKSHLKMVKTLENNADIFLVGGCLRVLGFCWAGPSFTFFTIFSSCFYVWLCYNLSESHR